MGLRNYAEWKYKDNIYWVLGMAHMKNPQTRMWEQAVVYCPREQQDKIFVREINEFFSRFEMVMDGFAPPDIKMASTKDSPEHMTVMQRYGMPVVALDDVYLANLKKGNDNGKTRQGQEGTPEEPSSHSTEEG